MRKTLFLFSFLLFSHFLSAQVYNHLVLAQNNGFTDIDFSATNAVIGGLNTNVSVANLEGITHAENPFGQVMFYATGQGIFSPNGTPLPITGGAVLDTDPAITEITIARVPGFSLRFYVFYTSSQGCGLLYYCLVDMTLNGGTGAVFQANTLLSDTLTNNGLYAEGKEIIRKPQSNDLYLVVRRCGFGFEQFRISQTGIALPQGLLTYNPTITNPTVNGKGELEYSNERLAYAHSGADRIDVFPFNPCNAVLSNSILSSGISYPYGIEFSPDGDRLFFTSREPVFINLGYIIIGSGALVSLDQTTADNCNGGTQTSDNITMGQIERARNNRLYSPMIGTCSLVEIFNPNTNSPTINLLQLSGQAKPGLSDFSQALTSIGGVDISLDITPVSCKGGSNGEVSIEINGGKPPYDFAWSTGDENTPTLNGLSAGSYIVVVKDASCADDSTVLSFAIPEPDSLLIETFTEDPLCFEGVGNYVETITGGNTPYTVSYSNGFDPDNALAGTYDIFVVDSKGCTASGSFTINQPDRINWNDTIIEIECFDSTGLYILSDLEGGTGRLLANNRFDTILEYSAGEYTVTVRDSLGCSEARTISFTQPEDIEIDVEIIQADCDIFEAEAIATTSGGTGEISLKYLGINSDAFPPGKYVVQATDENGCRSRKLFEFKPEPSIIHLPNVITPNGDGLNDFFEPIVICGQKSEFKIFNRWGNLLFKSREGRTKWFGRDFGGDPLPQDTYIALIEITDSRGIISTFEHPILVSR